MYLTCFYALRVQTYKFSGRIFFLLTLRVKCQTKIAADDTFFYFYLSEEIWFDVSCESRGFT